MSDPKRVALVARKALKNMTSEWQLTESELALVVSDVGGLNQEELSEELLHRIGLLLGIYSDLVNLFPFPDRVAEFIRKPHPRLHNHSVLECLCSPNLDDLIHVKQVLGGYS